MNFSKTKPDLIEGNTVVVLQEVTGAKIDKKTFSENICNSLQGFYDDYFKKYFFFLLLIIILILFLLYRYYKNKELKKEKQIIMSDNNNYSSPSQINSKQDELTKEIYRILKEKKQEKNKFAKNNNYDRKY